MYFKKHFTLKVVYHRKAYELECRVEHMLIGKKEDTWLYFCDEYGRTGTSQCFDATRFKIQGGKRYNMLTTDGMTVTAISPKGVYTDVETFEVVDADGLTKKEEQAVRLLQSAGNGYDMPIEVGYSGGKDSDVILHLCNRAGINVRPIYKNTTIDPPGTIKHAVEHGAEVMQPEKSFFRLISEMGMPNRFQRHCCSFLKEYKVLDRSVMGIRKAESVKRDMQYEEPTECRVYGRGRKKQTAEVFYPILDWTDEDVLNYVERYDINLHPLYYDKDGFVDPRRRLGCMCCPMAYYKNRIDYFSRYPGMVRAYIRAAQKYLETHPDSNVAEKYTDVYEWFVREVFFDKQRVWEDHKTVVQFASIDYKGFLERYFDIRLPEA